MATVEHTASGMFGKIPLGRRIAELMLEKGDAFSIRAVAERIGENRETFRQTLLGNRPISISLIEKVSNALHVSEERLRQLDTAKKQDDLNKLLNANSRTKVMMMRAQTLATELVEVALGSSERGFSLNNLGRVQYLQMQYDEAHQTWLKALEFAKTIHEEYEDPQLLKIVSANLMLTYIIRREYSNIEELLQIVEYSFPENSQALGMVYYARMRVQKDRGNLETAKTHAYRSLEYYEQTNEKKDIGHALINVAYCEYLLGEYQASARFLEKAMKTVKDYEDILIRVINEYIKTLTKLGKYDTAIGSIEQYESLAKDYPYIWEKWQIMLTILKDDPTYAERVSNDSNATLNVRFAACKCLFEYFAKHGDSANALKYYEKGRIYSNDKSDFYEMEGF